MPIDRGQLSGIETVTLENTAVRVVALVGKGADVYSVTSLDTGVDPLWKARWGPEHMRSGLLAMDSSDNWFTRCPGGWQVLVPSGGVESYVRGALQPQHGEASVVPWRIESTTEDRTGLELRVSSRLTRSPLLLERVFHLAHGSSELRVTDKVINEGGESFPVTFTHHPTLGAPFLASGCRIHTNARGIEVDDLYEAAHSPYAPGTRLTWPGDDIDLSVVPGRGAPRQLLCYLEFDGAVAWYQVDNRELDTCVRVSWDPSSVPYAWFFQEMDATRGYPWFGSSYLMAIEPSSTKPGRGLQHATAIGASDSLGPGESREYQLSLSVTRLGDDSTEVPKRMKS